MINHCDFNVNYNNLDYSFGHNCTAYADARNDSKKDGFLYLTGTVWALFHPQEVQEENLSSINVVNQVAELHYLQQHDNRFNI